MVLALYKAVPSSVYGSVHSPRVTQSVPYVADKNLFGNNIVGLEEE